MKAKAVLSIVFIFLVSVVVANKNVAADDISLWVGTGQPTKTLLQANMASDTSDKFCQQGVQNELLYMPNVNNIPSWIFKQPSPVQGCWYKTGYGLFGATRQGYYLKKNGNDMVAKLRNTATHTFYPVGNSSRLIGIYNSGYTRYMYMYEDLNAAAQLQSSIYYDEYVLDPLAARWSLTEPGTTTPLRMQRVGWSENGQWLVVEASNGFVRVNTTTKELLTFESSLYAYGYGQDPTYELSISNDGRYAVIAGGNVVDRSDFLYDLSTCQPVAGQPLARSPGCGRRNFKADVFPGLTTGQAAQRFVFNSDATNITVDAIENNQINRYVVTAAGKDYHGLDYLALGDSYSSGEGEYDGKGYNAGTDGDGESVPSFLTGIDNYPYKIEKCHVSPRSYPYLLAATATLTQNGFRSVTCSGAKASDVIGSGTFRYDGNQGNLNNRIISDIDLKNVQDIALTNFTPGRAAQIEFISRYKPRVVTIGIGGNDIGFGDIIESCLQPGTCAYAADERSSLGKVIQQKYYVLLDMYRQLHLASPTTRFYAVGYPQVFGPNNLSCPSNVWLNDTERNLARHTIDYLNKIIHYAADAAGVTYLDISGSFSGHELCNPDGAESAMNATSFAIGTGGVSNDDHPVSPLGVPIVTFGNETYHPNPLGHRMIADKITEGMGYSTITTYNPCPQINSIICTFQPVSVAPPIDTYFTDYQTVQVDYAKQAKLVDSPLLIVNGKSALQPGSTTQIDGITSDDSVEAKLLPNSEVTFAAYSTYRSLGTMRVDANGVVHGQLVIPSDLEPGYHTLVMTGTNLNYKKIKFLQTIVVYKTIDDLDGDGLPNTTDPCQFVSPAGLDADRDGIDDACDGLITKAPDTTKPVVAAVVQGVNDPSAWLNHQVTIMWTVTDDSGDGIAAPASILATTEGEHTYRS
ncbi:MAG: SGNH/GDSL hydrolase family protein, partial [Candidatus Saccharimonadales bacterium]